MSTSSSSTSSTVSTSRPNSKRQSLSTIESSVTRLLVSTKHLLESLTQWARQEADDKFVSDAYVKLGNDFRAATRAFTNAGVDISDIGDVPQALRIVLEAALSEAPSQENLDRFLPNIRNIIVTLLQSLKTKQNKAKALSQEKQQQKSKISTETETNTDFKAPAKSPTHLSDTSSSKASMQPQHNRNDALTQLQKGNFIQRRASKRFSAYQYAKLANYSPSSNLPRITSSEGNNAKNLVFNSNGGENKVDISKATASDNDASTYIFLRIHDKTKKAKVKLPLSLSSLRLLFVEKFAYSPGSTSFPDIYLQDPQTGISYELEDHLLEVDVKPGSLLCLNEPEPSKLSIKQLEIKIQTLTNKVESFNSNILTEVKDAIKAFEIPSPQPAPTAATKNADSPKTNAYNSADFKELLSIQHELKIMRQIQNSNKEHIKSTVSDLVKKVKEFQENGLDVSKSSNRSYMEVCHLKLSEESDILLTKVDDLQDIIEALRKDVAQRGVRIGEKQLKNTHKEIEVAKGSLMKMSEYIAREKTVWKNIWEAELDKVCEEQQFFNLQDDLTQDLEDDIRKIEETYDLIEQCSLEQSKQGVYKRNRIVAQLHIPEPGESIHDLKDAVLNEVVALKPNHESRLEAIAKAEKLREKEREMMKLTQFQEELGDFVEDNKLKKSGGIEEIERIRQLRDSENLKSSFGII